MVGIGPMSSIAPISIQSSFGAAQEGVQRGLDLAARATSSLSQGEVDPQNIIMLIQGQRTVEASLAVLRTSDEMSGTLLNVKV